MSIEAAGKTTLTATPTFSSAADASLVTYTWKISEGEKYAKISSSKNTAVVTGTNTTTQAQSATVFVTATYNGVSKSATQTISIAAASSENPENPNTPSDESTITITYSSSHGTKLSSKSHDKTDSGYVLTADDLPDLTETGYIFGGWVVSTGSTTAKVGDTITENTTLYAIWTAISYTVKFGANGGSGDAISEIRATYDEEFEVPENSFTYDGYKASANTWNTSKDGSGTIFIAGSKAKNLTAENGAMVTLYAVWVEKDAHSITYLDSDGTTAISGMSPATFKETEDVDLGKAVPSKDGYKFEGWAASKDATATISSWKAGEKTSDVTLYATWTANTNTAYKVKHLLQNVALTDYEEQASDEENSTGTTGEQTSATAKTYSGFTAKEITQQTIAGDGSTVVSVYYDRNEITLTLNLDGGNGTQSLTGKYGTKVTAPENPTKTGYSFVSWSPALPETFPAKNAVYTATWTEEKTTVTSIVISVPTYSGLDDFITVSESENAGGFPSIIFTAESGFDHYYWSHFYGTAISTSDGSNTEDTVFALRKSTLEPGSHTVMAIVKKDENYYSATVEIIKNANDSITIGDNK